MRIHSLLWKRCNFCLAAFTSSPIFPCALDKSIVTLIWNVLYPSHFCINHLLWPDISWQNTRHRGFTFPLQLQCIKDFWKHRVFLKDLLCCVGVCAPAAPFVSLPLCVLMWIWVTVWQQHTHSECIPALFSGFSKGWIRLLPADCAQRWKPAELSHGDAGTKAWWIRAAVFTSELVSDKQSQRRQGCVAAGAAVIADWL